MILGLWAVVATAVVFLGLAIGWQLNFVSGGRMLLLRAADPAVCKAAPFLTPPPVCRRPAAGRRLGAADQHRAHLQHRGGQPHHRRPADLLVQLHAPLPPASGVAARGAGSSAACGAQQPLSPPPPAAACCCRARLSRKHWSHRRKRLAGMAGLELSLALVNSIFYLAPNAFLLAHECRWFSGVVVWCAFVRWTMWNSIFLIYWVEARSNNPATGRWSELARHARRGAPAAAADGTRMGRPQHLPAIPADMPARPAHAMRAAAGFPLDGDEAQRTPAVIDAPLWMHWRKLPLWLATGQWRVRWGGSAPSRAQALVLLCCHRRSFAALPSSQATLAAQPRPHRATQLSCYQQTR